MLDGDGDSRCRLAGEGREVEDVWVVRKKERKRESCWTGAGRRCGCVSDGERCLRWRWGGRPDWPSACLHGGGALPARRGVGCTT